jgi:uncharacterized membrane protein
MTGGTRKDRDPPATHLPAIRHEALDRPSRSDGQVRKGEGFPGAIAVASERFAGPLPPPDLLADYERALPGLAERIVAMAENEGRHRRSLEARLVRLSELGLLSGFTLSLLAIGGGILLAWMGKGLEGLAPLMGKGLEGLAPLMVSMLSIVAIFVVRRNGTPSDTTE